MKRIFLYFGVVALVLAGNSKAKAQGDSSVYHESVVVVGDYNPVLDGVTEKVNTAPAVNVNFGQELAPHFNYDITPRRITPLTPTTGIKAAKVIASPTRLYNNYMRFGLGHDFAGLLDFNPMADLYYTSTRNDIMAYGVRLFHETDITTIGKEDESAPSPDYYGRHRQSDTKIDLFGKYILNKKHLLSASFGFDRQYFQYYGFSDSTLFANTGLTHTDIAMKDYGNAYNNIALSLGAQSLNTDPGKLGYDAAFNMSDLWTKLDLAQFSMSFDGTAHYGFHILSKYKGIAALHFNWQGFRQENQQTPAVTQPLHHRHLVTINPNIEFLFRDFKIHAGLALGLNGYDDDDNTTPNLFPDIYASKSFRNNAMSVTFGFVGGYIANDWNSIRLFNPYVYQPSTCATVDNNLYAHLRINFSKKLILNLGIDNHFYSNKMFFALDQFSSVSLANWFNPYYLDVNNMTLNGVFTFVNDEMIKLSVGGEYYLYYNKSVEVPLYHTPDFTLHIDAEVNYKDKWFFSLSSLLIGKMDAYYVYSNATGMGNVTGSIPAHFGVKLGAEYRHSRALSFFAKFDNVTFQRYFIWANYPAERFNAMLGLTYTLPHK